MNYTKEYCIDLLQKVIDDIDLQRGGIYYDKNTPFEVYYEGKHKNLYTKDIVLSSWLAYATVPKDGWKGGFIIVHIDDDTGKAITYMNSALGGRPIVLPLKEDENGKYFIPLEVLPDGVDS